MNISLMLNRMIKGPTETLNSWKEMKQDPNNIGSIMHDEAVAENPHVIKPGSEEILHTDSITKLMRGKNIDPDAALKEKLNLEKNAMLGPILKESEVIENGIAAGVSTGVSTGTPIAPMSPSKSKIVPKIENAYKMNKINKLKRKEL